MMGFRTDAAGPGPPAAAGPGPAGRPDPPEGHSGPGLCPGRAMSRAAMLYLQPEPLSKRASRTAGVTFKTRD